MFVSIILSMISMVGSVPVFMLDMIMQMKAKVHSIFKLVVFIQCLLN